MGNGLNELKGKAFDVRRQIDIIDKRKMDFVKEYNSIVAQIMKLEQEEVNRLDK